MGYQYICGLVAHIGILAQEGDHYISDLAAVDVIGRTVAAPLGCISSARYVPKAVNVVHAVRALAPRQQGIA
jgi:isochorismate hydrolase